MKYQIGQKFTYLQNNNVVCDVEIVGFRYELSRQIKSSSRYLTETEMTAYVDKEILVKGLLSNKDIEIRLLEQKWNIKLKEEK